MDIQVHERSILKAITYSAQRLLVSEKWETAVQDALTAIGEAARVSRVYIFLNRRNERQPYVVDQLYEWVAPGITPQIHNPDMTGLNFHPSFIRWINAFEGKEIIYGLVKDFPKSERDVLEAQQIISIVAAPIYICGEWHGFVGFDECHVERIWELEVVEALRAAAAVFSGALERHAIEKSLKESEEAYSSLLTSLPIGVLRLDKEGVIIYENPKFARIIGVPPGQKPTYIGKKLIDVPGVIESGAVSYLQDVLSGKEVSNVTIPFASPYGKHTKLLMSGIPLLNERREVTGVILTASDIS